MAPDPARHDTEAPTDPGDHAVVPLGRAPRPTTADELGHRLRGAVRLALWSAFDVAGLDGARITAEPAPEGGPDLDRLDVDLTGVELTPRPVASTPTPPARARRAPESAAAGRAPAAERPDWAALAAEFADPAGRERAVLRSASLGARPVVVAGVAVHVSGSLRDLPFAWATSEGGGLAAEVDTGSLPSSARVRVAVARADVARLLRVAVDTAGQGELRVLSLRVDLDATGPRALRVRGFVRVGRRGMTMGARLRAVVHVDDAMVATVPVLAITSVNPVVAGLLLGLRGRLRALRNGRFPLVAGRMRVRDVSVSTGEDVVLEVEVSSDEVPRTP